MSDIVIEIIEEIVGTIEIVESGPQGPPGAGGASTRIFGEEPAGTINGSNAVFTTAFEFVPTQIEVRINGLYQRPQVDFTTPTTQSIQLTSSPETSDYLAVDYERN